MQCGKAMFRLCLIIIIINKFGWVFLDSSGKPRLQLQEVYFIWEGFTLSLPTFTCSKSSIDWEIANKPTIRLGRTLKTN